MSKPQRAPRGVTFRLNPALDVASLSARFASHRRVRIQELLDSASAGQLRAELEAANEWRQVINSGPKIYELDRATRSTLSPERARLLDDAVYSAAREGFQFRFEAIRVPDDQPAREADGSARCAFASWLSCGEGRDLMRTITGKPRIDFADAQATAFAAGDFLTGHDDLVAGKDRLAAYVLGLTPTWRLEWGGLLIFHPNRGESFSGNAPAFNTLDLFDVPIMHSVSWVTPAAAYRRLSMTGWLRSHNDAA